MEEIRSLPKADVHLHLQSMLDIDRVYSIAQHKNLLLDLSKEEFKEKQENLSCLSDLFSLLRVLEKVPSSYVDIYHCLQPYYRKLKEQNVNYIEPSIYFSGFEIHPAETLKGVLMAANEAESLFGIKTNLLYLFGRPESERKMKEDLQAMVMEKEKFVGINASGNELSMRAKEIQPVFEYAAQLGFCKDGNATIHTGEDAPAEEIISSLYYLDLKRIDHGVRACEDPFLMKFLGENEFSLAMCPISNKKLKVCEKFCGGKYVYDRFISAGCRVSINSDDPYLYGSFTGDVYEDFFEYYEDRLPRGVLAYVDLIKNAYFMSFMSETEKRFYVNMIDLQLNKNNLY